MTIKDNLTRTLKDIPAGVKLVAVSKTMPPEVILEAWEAGQRTFGENKAQELINKQPLLPADIQWHFIGHLQTNKVKYIAPFVEMIESVDSLKLLREINKEAAKCGRVINCLLQFHIATEETKYGLDISEAESILKSDEYKALKNIQIAGVMGMATFTDNHDTVRNEFGELVRIFNHLRRKYFRENPGFKEISMGMSGDYLLAIEEGSTIVRIGTAIFGTR
jgi:PLP dependent protein